MCAACKCDAMFCNALRLVWPPSLSPPSLFAFVDHPPENASDPRLVAVCGLTMHHANANTPAHFSLCAVCVLSECVPRNI